MEIIIAILGVLFLAVFALSLEYMIRDGIKREKQENDKRIADRTFLILLAALLGLVVAIFFLAKLI